MKARQAILVVLAAAVTLTAVAAAAPDSRKPWRLVVTEAGVRFSFRVPRWWESFSSIPTKKSPSGPISLNKSFVGPQVQRRSSIGRASPRATTPIRVPVCWPRRLADRPPISRPQCRRRPAPSSSRGLWT
jgi:hypothetical protein